MEFLRHALFLILPNQKMQWMRRRCAVFVEVWLETVRRFVRMNRNFRTTDLTVRDKKMKIIFVNTCYDCPYFRCAGGIYWCRFVSSITDHGKISGKCPLPDGKNPQPADAFDRATQAQVICCACCGFPEDECGCGCC